MTTKGKKVFVGSLVLVAGLVLAAVAFAHGGRHGCGDEGIPGMYPGKWMDRLGVTAEQKTQIQAVLGKYRPEAEPLVRKMVTERRDLRRLIQDGAADEKAVRSQAAKVAAVDSDLAVVRARASKEVRALLTPEQIAKLAELQAEREKKVDRFMEHRQQGKPVEKR